jgi:hypothetical protein
MMAESTESICYLPDGTTSRSPQPDLATWQSRTRKCFVGKTNNFDFTMEPGSANGQRYGDSR